MDKNRRRWIYVRYFEGLIIEAKHDNIEPSIAQGIPGHVMEAEYFYFDTDPLTKKQLAIIGGGYEKCAPDFKLNRTNYPYYAVLYTLSGKCTYETADKSYKLTPGTLSLIIAGEDHRYICDPNDPMEHIFITFTGSEVKQLLAENTLAERRAFRVQQPDRVQFFMDSILQHGSEKFEYSHKLCCSYLRTMLMEQAAVIASSDEYMSMSLSTYRRCRRYMDEHFSTIKSPSQVADACKINVRYMAQLFKDYDRITPREYITRLKLNRAAQLLLNTDWHIKTIARLVGFDDPYHFSRNFKRMFDISPRNFKNTQDE